MNITQEIQLFRESSRHLWNTYLKREADDYTYEVFNKICKMLFEDQIVKRLNLKIPAIPITGSNTVLNEYRLFAPHHGKLPMHVNRDLPSSGYWDYPIGWIPPEQKPDIRPICFYDFDFLGWCRLEFYRARIVDCKSHPELNGRDALIPCHQVEIEVIENTEEIV